MLPILSIFFLHPSQLGKIGIVNGKYLSILLLLLFFASKYNAKVLCKLNSYQLILVIQILFFLALSIFTGDYTNLLTAASLLLIFIYYLYLRADADLLVKAARFYVLVMSIISILALISLIGFYLGLFKQSLIATTESGRNIYLMGPSLSVETLSHDGIVRPAGPFIEPGQLGLHIIFALLINYLLGGDKKKELCLIIGVLATISMGAYVALIIYLFLSNALSIKFKKLAIYASILLTILTVFIFTNDFLLEYITSRLDNVLTLGNRLQGYEAFFENIKYISIFGVDQRYLHIYTDASTGATFFGTFVQFGYLGAIIVNLQLIVFFLYGALKLSVGGLQSTKLQYLMVMSIIGSFLLHRPFILMYSFYILFLILTGLLNIKSNVRIHNKRLQLSDNAAPEFTTC